LNGIPEDFTPPTNEVVQGTQELTKYKVNVKANDLKYNWNINFPEEYLA